MCGSEYSSGSGYWQARTCDRMGRSHVLSSFTRLVWQQRAVLLGYFFLAGLEQPPAAEPDNRIFEHAGQRDGVRQWQRLT